MAISCSKMQTNTRTKDERVEHGVLGRHPVVTVPHDRIEHAELASGVVTQVARIHPQQVRQPARKQEYCHTKSLRKRTRGALPPVYNSPHEPRQKGIPIRNPIQEAKHAKEQGGGRHALQDELKGEDERHVLRIALGAREEKGKDETGDHTEP